MSDSHTPSNGNRNLLFGILALQVDFISRDQLTQAAKSWLKDKTRSLDEILIEQGALQPSVRDLLLPLVQQHIEDHEGDPAKSLAALSSIGSAAAELRAFGDEQIDATVSLVGQDRSRTAIEPTIDHGTSSGTADNDLRRESAGDRFRIIRPHAKGGLGKVSVAKDLELNRDVALKEIQSRHADDEASRSRFLLEAEVTGGLEHPGIVPVYGLGRYEDGRPFYAMRFIKGDSLQEAADRFYQGAAGDAPDFASVEFRKLLGRFVDVCEAIEYAHSRGVLHRDLKPGNIMLGKYGETLVVDWGLAKAKGREDIPANDEQAMRPASGSGAAPTQMGSAIGTPAFMPPEQATGNLDQIGPASDTYSLGATLYYVLTAQRPFTGKRLSDVLSAVEQGDFPHPRSVNATIPKPLEAICLRAMALRPSDRYTSPIALADDVQRWLGDEPVSAYAEPFTARAQRWVRRHQTLAASFTALLLAGLVALAVSTILIGKAQQQTAEALSQEKAARKDADQQREEANKQREEADSQRADADAQRKIAENALIENQRISANLALARAQELSENGKPAIGLNWYVRAMELAPDGDEDFRDLIRANLAEWKSMTIERRQSFLLKKGGSADGARLSSDGSKLYICRGGLGVVQWDTATKEPRLLKFPDVDVTWETKLVGGVATISPVALSPDETTCVAGLGKKLYFWNVSDGAHIGEPLSIDDIVTAIDYHPNGKLIAVGSQKGECFLIDIQSKKTTGKSLSHGKELRSVAFRPDGKVLMTGGYDQTIRRWDLSSREEIQPPLKHDSLGISAAAWSPDGKRIVAGDLGGVRIWDVERAESILRVRTGAIVPAACFSKDGKLFAFAVNDGTVRIWDAESLNPLHHPLLHDGTQHFVGFDSNRNLFTVATMATLHKWKLAKDLLTTTDAASVSTNRVDVDRAGSKIAFAGMKGVLTLNDVETGELIGEPLNFREPIASVTFNPAGDQILVTGFRGSSRVYATEGLKQVGETLASNGMAVGGAFVDDQHVAIAATQDGTVRVHNFYSGDTVGDAIRQLMPSLVDISGDKMLTGGFGAQIMTWSLKSREPITPTIETGAQVGVLRYSPDGKHYAAGGMGRAAMIWDAETAEPVATLPHPAAVEDICFSGDGCLLATSAADDKVRLWHLATGKRIGPPRFGEHLTHVRSDENNRILFVGSTDGNLILYRWKRPPALIGDAATLRLWATARTGLELQPDGNHRVLRWNEWQEVVKQLRQLPPVIAK